MIGKVVELSVKVSYQLFPDYGSLSLSDCNSHKLTFETALIASEKLNHTYVFEDSFFTINIFP